MKDAFLRMADRGCYIIPMLLRDTRSPVILKAVLLDLSAKGLRCFSNDRRILIMSEDVFLDKTFGLEFDFFGVDTRGIEGRVAHLRPGKHPQFERQIGLSFTRITPMQARDINRAIASAGAPA